jgi:hypothetical protein
MAVEAILGSLIVASATPWTAGLAWAHSPQKNG